MGIVADRLDPAVWELYALLGPDYPTDVVFRGPRPPVVLGEAGSVSPFGAPSAPSGKSNPQERSEPPPKSARQAVLGLIPPMALKWLGYRRSAARVRDVLQEHRIEIFQAMDAGPQATVVGARQAGCRVVAVYCAPPPVEPVDPLTRSYSRRSFAAAHVRVGLSRHSIRMWAEFLGVEESAFRLIYNGVDVDDHSGVNASQVRDELGIPEDAVVVGMTGRMDPVKGPTVLARAAVAVAGAHPNALFVFTGSGDELPAVERIFRDAGMSDRVRLLGFRADAPRITAAYDVAVVPSVFPEPFGIVVIEAMACAKPVIGSRTGGIPEIIVDGETGVLVDPNDPAPLARKLAELLSSPARRMEMGQAGLERVTRQFSRKAMFDGYEQVYQELLAAPPGSPWDKSPSLRS